MAMAGCACKEALETTPVNCWRFGSCTNPQWVCSRLFDLWPLSGGKTRPWSHWKWCLNNGGDEQTEVYWHTYYCLLCTVQNSLKSSDQVTRQPWMLPPFQNIYFEQLPHFVLHVEKFRSWQSLGSGDFNYMLHDIYCTGQKLAFCDRQCGKQSGSFLLNLHLESNKRRKNSHCGSVSEMSALSPPRSCLYQLHCIWSIHNEEGKWQTLLCWWEAVRDEERGRRVLESSKQIKMEMFPLLLNTPVSKLPAGVWGARRGRRGREAGGEDKSRGGGGDVPAVFDRSQGWAVWSDARRGRVAPHKNTHAYRWGKRGWGAARRQSGHGVLGNMSSFDMVQSYMKISLCYQETAGVRKCNAH